MIVYLYGERVMQYWTRVIVIVGDKIAGDIMKGDKKNEIQGYHW